MRHPLPRSLVLFQRYSALPSLPVKPRWLFACLLTLLIGQSLEAKARIIPGAERMAEYLPKLRGKRVAVLINQTSLVGNKLLADTLLRRGIRVVKIFVPEHGFRGTADAGAHIANTKDSATGLPVISLYGDNKKPRPEQLADVDILVYDLQDVGVRFFTYIATLQYAMEACAGQGKSFLVLDRPDPQGSAIDGPLLDTGNRSFVGMQPVPVLYGMTPGEYALMLKGEGWFQSAERLQLSVIACGGYEDHGKYHLPVPPSPNLRTDDAILVYPSLCFFEGTPVSVGRGTGRPFMQWGHPAFEGKGADSFRPAAMVGATHPPYEGKTCYGKILNSKDAADSYGSLQLRWLVQAYQWYPDKAQFFTPFFNKLAGTAMLRKQIEQGLTEAQIRASWQPELERFKRIRAKYLMYHGS